MPETSLLFMDESYSKITKIASVTACQIPIDKIDDFRIKFYSKVKKRLKIEEHVFVLPDLHGCDMLRNYKGATEEMVIGAYKDVVDLVIDENLKIFRIGHYKSKKVNDLAGKSENGKGFAYKLDYLAILNSLGSYTNDNYIIPIMDGLNEDQARRFSSSLSSINISRSSALFHEDNYIVKNPKHIIGETFYAKSKYSVLTQTTDVCSYLRHKLDMERAENEITDFTKSLVNIGKRLDEVIVKENIIVLNIDGKLVGPESVNYSYENPKYK